MVDETYFADLRASVEDARQYMADHAMKPFKVLYSQWNVDRNRIPMELYRDRPIRFILSSGVIAYLSTIAPYTLEGSFALVERDGITYRLVCEQERLVWYVATWTKQE